jgi:CBS domain-containing protein
MLVQQILKQKADAGVLTVPRGTLVSEAAKILSDRRIGTVVISDDGKAPLGILSERDIVREVGRQGGACLDQKVDDIMSTKLVTCSLNATADQVLSTMTEKRFRHMPVVENDEMVGIITLGDVVKSRLTELSMEKEALEGMIMGY